MQVFVVMSNDYPDSVFTKEEDAERYIAEKNEEGKKAAGSRHNFAPRIYWRHYEFQVR